MAERQYQALKSERPNEDCSRHSLGKNQGRATVDAWPGPHSHTYAALLICIFLRFNSNKGRFPKENTNFPNYSVADMFVGSRKTRKRMPSILERTVLFKLRQFHGLVRKGQGVLSIVVLICWGAALCGSIQAHWPAPAFWCFGPPHGRT